MILDRKDLSKFIFNIFNDSGIKYALMRDIEKSLFSSKAKDYDVAIQEEDLPKILDCFRKNNQLNIFYTNRRSFCISVGFIIKHHGSYACFAIDFIFRFSIYGINFTSTEKLLQETDTAYIDNVKISILNTQANHFVSVFPAIYHNYLERSADKLDWAIIQHFTNSNFRLIRKNNFVIKIRFMKWRLLMESYALIRHVLTEIKIYYSRNTITTIAFLGPDGAGKTAILSLVAQELSKAFVNHEILHLKPKLLFKKRYELRGVVTEPHAKEPRALALGLLKILIWNFELAVFTFFTKRPNQTLAIFDRHMLDVLVDPRRYRLRDNYLIRKLTKLFLPDLTIIVSTEPELASSRKGEINIGLARELIRAYTDLDNDLRDDSVIVMNNSNLEVAVRKTYRELHKVNFL